MDISVIIVNWNAAEYVVPCVASICAETKDLEFEIIVVDNASQDNSCSVIEERCPSVKLIRSPKNIGFARANNLGFQHSSGKMLLFLNPDTELRGPAISLMYACLDAAPDIGLLGCRLLNSDLTLQTSSIHLFPTILNQLLDFEGLRRVFPRSRMWGMRPMFDPTVPVPARVEAVSGACQMVRREVFENVGLFSTDYYMYMEDLDLCYKVRQSGRQVGYLDTATVLHHAGKSSKKRGGEDFSGPMMRESLLTFLKKSRGAWYARLYRISTSVASAARIALLAPPFLLPFHTFEKDALRYSMSKWYKILRWSLGLEGWVRIQTANAAAEGK